MGPAARDVANHERCGDGLQRYSSRSVVVVREAHRDRRTRMEDMGEGRACAQKRVETRRVRQAHAAQLCCVEEGSAAGQGSHDTDRSMRLPNTWRSSAAAAILSRPREEQARRTPHRTTRRQRGRGRSGLVAVACGGWLRKSIVLPLRQPLRTPTHHRLLLLAPQIVHLQLLPPVPS